jgi:lipopolysaccharide export system permease protein
LCVAPDWFAADDAHCRSAAARRLTCSLAAMRILTRYVVFEWMKVFLMTLIGFTMVIFIGLIGKEAVDKGISLSQLLQMCPYVLPQAMQFAVPGTMLLATTSIFGRMAAYNEIIAIKSLGISPMVFVWPILVLAVLMSFAETVLNDVAMSWGRLGVQRVFLASIEEVMYNQLRMRHTYNLGNVNIKVREVIDRRLIEPIIIVQASESMPAVTFSAQEAELRLLPDQGKLVVKSLNFELEGEFSYFDSGSQQFEISLDTFGNGNDMNRTPSTYALSELGPEIEKQQQLLGHVQQGMASQAAFAMLTGDFEALSESAWQVQERQLENTRNRLNRLNTEPWRRWANGFSCLCFVLIGVPVAMWLRFSEMLASFFICFLPILIVYYPLIAVSVDGAKDGTMPPQAVWLGNILLSLVGVWLLRRVNRN